MIVKVSWWWESFGEYDGRAHYTAWTTCDYDHSGDITEDDPQEYLEKKYPKALVREIRT